MHWKDELVKRAFVLEMDICYEGSDYYFGGVSKLLSATVNKI